MPRRSSSSRSLRTVLDNRALPAYLRTLTPGALAQICSRVGVADAAEFMALVPARQLVMALDASVWKSPRPGLPETFDPEELMQWLAVWLDIGDAFTAERLSAIPDEDLTLYLSHVLRVHTVPMWGFERSTEIEDLDRIYAPSYHESAYGNYFVTAAAPQHWEIARAGVDALWDHAPERLLRLFALLSGDESMLAPETDRESSNRDFSSQRAGTRERRGHVTAEGARAFLAFAHTSSLETLHALSEYDLETRRHLSLLDEPVDPATRAAAEDVNAAGDATAEGLTELQEAFEAAGLVEAPAATLLLTHDSPKPLPVVQLLARLAHDDPDAFDLRGRELAYLASVLIAGVAVSGQVMRAQDARSAALATCNLGLELLRSRQAAQIGIEREPGLVRLFLVGWRALGEIAPRVVNTLTRSLRKLQAAAFALPPAQRWLLDDAQGNLRDLQLALSRSDFAAARAAAELLSFVFDAAVCRALVPLLDEIPRIRSGAGSEALAWIESVAGLKAVARLLRRIPRPPHGHTRPSGA